jgi:hypothetical protein
MFSLQLLDLSTVHVALPASGLAVRAGSKKRNFSFSSFQLSFLTSLTFYFFIPSPIFYLGSIKYDATNIHPKLQKRIPSISGVVTQGTDWPLTSWEIIVSELVQLLPPDDLSHEIWHTV